LNVDLTLGGRTQGTLDPKDEVETYRVALPAKAALTATVVPLQKTGPVMSLSVYAPDGSETIGDVYRRGARVKSYVAATSDAYDVVVFGDGSATGGYLLTVTWKTPARTSVQRTLAAGGADVNFVADAAAKADFVVRPARGSKAMPRLIEAVHEASGLRVGFKPAKTGAKSHAAKGVALGQTGDWTLHVEDAGLGGDVLVSVLVRQPRARRRALVIPSAPDPTPDVPDLSQVAVGVEGGLVVGQGDVVGARVDVKPGAVSGVAFIEVGAAPDVAIGDSDLAAVGPAVFCGPSGTQFAKDVIVTVPFDVAKFPAGFDGLDVLVTEDGTTSSLVPHASLKVDSVAGTISFPVRHFTTFQAVSRVTEARFSSASSDGQPGDEFGAVVGVDGDTFVAGAPGTDEAGANSGSAYVFVRSGATWTSQRELTAGDAADGDRFGACVAIDQNTVVVGAPFADEQDSDAGAVYVFVRSGSTWTQQQKIVAADGVAGDVFGEWLDVSGDRLVVGAPGADDDGSSSGAVYVYERIGGVWSLDGRFTASDAAAGDRFGEHVSIDAGFVAVGAQRRNVPSAVRGKAYVFSRASGSWLEERALVVPGGDVNGQGFGCDVAMSGQTVVVGALADAETAADAGAAYVFTRSGGTWPLQQKLLPTGQAAGFAMGTNVAIDGDAVVASAPFGGPGQTGAFLAFARTGTTWTARRKIAPNVGSAEDLAGIAVALEAGRAVAGVPGIDDLGFNPGFVYVYDGVDR
jgi:hypothetical protein